MREGNHAVVALRRTAMKPRLREVTPFSRYSRSDVELFAELVHERRMTIVPLAQAGDETYKRENERLKVVHRKLLDELKMRP